MTEEEEQEYYFKIPNYIKNNLIYIRMISERRKAMPCKKEYLECPALEECSLYDLMIIF
jgi:hypothetical protein